MMVNRILYPDIDHERPRTRGDCARPCPYVGCRYHLYIDVNERTGSIKLNFPDLEVWQMKNSCALDIADGETPPLHALGELLNVTRERARQVEKKALLELLDYARRFR